MRPMVVACIGSIATSASIIMTLVGKAKKVHSKGYFQKSIILGPCGNRLCWDPARRHSSGPRPALGPGSEAHGPALGRASEPGPRAGLGPGLCLRAGSQYSLFPHGPNIIDFWKYHLECTLFAFPMEAHQSKFLSLRENKFI